MKLQGRFVFPYKPQALHFDKRWGVTSVPELPGSHHKKGNRW